MSLATRIGEEFNLVRDEGMARLNALAPYNGIISTDTKQQQENLVFRTTVGNKYKLVDMSRFRKIDGKVIDTYGPELVTNGDFSDGTTGWKTVNATLEIINGTVKVTTTANSGYLSKDIATEPGKTYSLEVSVGPASKTTAISVGTTQSAIDVYTNANVSMRRFTATFTAKSTTSWLLFQPWTPAIGQYGHFNNISVREVQTIDFSRSGQDPFEVYTNTVSTVPNNVLAGDYVVTNVNDTIYRAKIDAPSGTALTNTTYFETRDYISNQVLAMQKADGTIHTETLFKDAYAVETTNVVLVKNGWSKVENGLYSKGAVVGTPVGYWQA